MVGELLPFDIFILAQILESVNRGGVDLYPCTILNFKIVEYE